MKQSWTTGLSEERTLDIKSCYASSLVLRKRLVELINNKIDSSMSTARSKKSYETPNWDYLQADQVGYERALFEVIDLISE